MSAPLLMGEVFVDFTLNKPGVENKLRLGGIAHAARSFWALGVPFRVAAVLPDYLEQLSRNYFATLGCIEFFVLGHVRGAPNVMTIIDAQEVSDQGYEDLLRDEKSVELFDLVLTEITHHVLIFPGRYDLRAACAALPESASLHIDVAYDVVAIDALLGISNRIETILISTSSPLFGSLADRSMDGVAAAFREQSTGSIILKENRGGARMWQEEAVSVESLPAQLGTTLNSVGVGDAFAAAYVAHLSMGAVEAAWRATYAAAAYSQTTYPDVFKRYVQRDLKLSLADMRALGGCCLPWESRPGYPIYLAAPDFANAERRAIDRAIASLEYHNFAVRRPVKENGELPLGASMGLLRRTYRADYKLLKACALVFAVPTGRDPGTLVEVGIALEALIPVVVYDPDGENRNTMVMAGARHYSGDLDSCLNAVFNILSGIRKQ